MKYTIIIIILNILSSVGFDHSEMNNIETQTTSYVELFYSKLEVKTNVPKLLNKYIDRQILRRTDVPITVWEEIRDSIDYELFHGKIIDIIPNFYTNEELADITDYYDEYPKIPIKNIEFKRELRSETLEFVEVRFVDSVNQILIDNGYDPL